MTTLFISRAGADAPFAAEIGKILEEAGFGVILQQWDFANANFMERMHAALTEGSRVIALLSPEYLASDHCQAEWQNAIARDPLNKNRRLVVMRVVECEPPGLLAGIAYWDLVPIRDNPALLADIVRNAVREDRERTGAGEGPYWRAPRVILDSDAIRPTPSFTGREPELAAIGDALRERDLVAIHGMGGVGKSSLAREFAWRERDRYAVVAWLHAETEDGIIDGLVSLGAQFVRGLDALPDRRAAAQQVITSVLGGFSKPVLLVFDNLEDERLLRTWLPRSGAQALITSRAAHWGGDIAPATLESWPRDDAAAYLRRESARTDLSDAEADELATALGGLPLALAHAAAYLRTTQTVSAASYLARLGRHLGQAPRQAEYPQAVFATFQTAIAKAESEAPGASAILCLAGVYAPEGIPEELFAQPADAYADNLRPALPDASAAARDLRATVADPASVDEALGALDRLSLIAFAPATRTFTVHRLVQAAARDLARDALEPWAESAVAAAHAAFPPIAFETWPACERLLSHARAALAALPAASTYLPAGHLANACAHYLWVRAAFAEAEPLVRRALAIREAQLGPADASVAESLHDLATLLIDTNRGHDAEPLLRRALAIREALGPEQPDVARSLHNLAIMLWNENRFAEAEPLYRRALAIRETALGAQHPDVAESLVGLAALLHLTNRRAEAEPLYRRAIALQAETLGPDHPDAAASQQHLAALLRDMGRLDEAEPLFRAALASFERSLGPEHPHVAQTLAGLALLLREVGRASEAEPLHRRALALREARLGPEHPQVARSLNGLAAVLRDTKRYDEAEALYRRALAIREASFGLQHHETAQSLNDLAILLRDTGRFEEAERLFRQALEVRESILGPDHHDVVQSRNDLTALQCEMHQRAPSA